MSRVHMVKVLDLGEVPILIDWRYSTLLPSESNDVPLLISKVHDDD